MERTDLTFWSRLWRELDLQGDPHRWHTRLMLAYAEPHRRYHNAEHLAECLAEYDSLQSIARQPRLGEFALWFHDAVYDPRSANNEENSAALAESCLAETRAAQSTHSEVRDLILATKNHQPKTVDAEVACDADLAILGQRPERYWRYEQAIADEYSWVPRDVYRAKRSEILEQFLARSVLFHTALARDRHERQARLNLAEAIARLRSTTS